MRVRSGAAVLLGLAVAVSCVGAACAQAHNPFGVGISEGGGSADGVMGWLLATQAGYERAMSGAMRAVKHDTGALASLCGLAFVYGVFHAAGPGHGKAVIASYMLADERALRRGVALALLAALLQGVVAIALVGVLALVFHATSGAMKATASLVEEVTFATIALLGAVLVVRKGTLLVAALRAMAPRTAPALAMAGGGGSRFTCEPADHVDAHVHGPDCGHAHMPDPATLGVGFSWRRAVATTVAAGARPCSGAILVLVFSLAPPSAFGAGVAAVAAMSAGTGLTTAGLAATAVLAKGVALRLVGPGGRGELVARGFEFAAALAVLVLGLGLLLGTLATGA